MTPPPAEHLAPSSGAEPAKRRRERWAIGIVAVLVAVLTFFEAHLAAVGGTVTLSSNIVIFALINLNVIFVVLLIFLVTRNVFKILLDRRRNILGAKLRSRLVLIFICFSLIPTFLLFIAATNITTTSIKSWIGGRVGQALTGAVEIARERLEEDARTLFPAADRVAAELSGMSEPASFPGILASARRLVPAGTALLFFEKGVEVAGDGEVPPVVRAEVLTRVKAVNGIGEGKGTLIGNEFAAAWRRAPGGVIIVAVRPLPPAEAARIREITTAYDEYHQVRLLDDPIRASYVGILILITLLIVFAASWMGIYLARQITIPVQLLAEGHAEVARAPASPETAFASRVLPVPGGPTSRTPLGMRAPSWMNFCGSLRNSTTSASSCLDSSTPATSANVTVGCSPLNMRARLLPKDMAALLEPCAWRKMNHKTPTIKMTGKIYNAPLINPVHCEGGLTSICTLSGESCRGVTPRLTSWSTSVAPGSL